MRQPHPCLFKDCMYVATSFEELRDHVRKAHNPKRHNSRWPEGKAHAPRVEGDDIEKAKADYDRLVAEGAIVEKGKEARP